MGLEESCIFYCSTPNSAVVPVPSLPEGCEWAVWRPSLRSCWPEGTSEGRRFWLVRWLMHYLGLYSGRVYGAILVRNQQRIVHSSVVLPKSYQFPVMEWDDIEIGPTWTVPDFRGKGLAVFAIRKVLELWAKEGRKFWYVSRESNAAGRRAAEKAGLIAVASGRRIKKMGLLPVIVCRR